MQLGMMQKADGDTMKKILFVCTGNTCRSPMAEGIFNDICKKDSLPFVGESAGLSTITGLPVSANSVSVLKEKGIDISCLTSTAITDVNMEDYILFAVMTKEHSDVLCYYGVPSEKIYILREDKGGVFDPYGGSHALYRVCRDEIEEAVKKLTEELREKI